MLCTVKTSKSFLSVFGATIPERKIPQDEKPTCADIPFSEMLRLLFFS
jgi:hypothetical protein